MRIPPLARSVFSLMSVLAPIACGGGEPRPSPPTPIAVRPAEAPQPIAEGAPSASAASNPASPTPTPVSGALPVVATSARFPRSIECTTAPRCAHPELVPPGERPDATTPAFFWEERFAKGKGLAFPRIAEVDLFGVVLEGEVVVQGDEEPARSARRLGVWSAFRAPGAGVTLGGAGRVVLLAATRDGAPLAKLVAELPKGAKAQAWKARANPIETVDLASAPSLDWGAGAYHARLGFEARGDAPAASLGVLVASKDAPVKEHVHDAEWELLAVIDGDGEMVEKPADAGGSERRTKVDGPTFLAVPKGEPHAWAPSGTRPLVAIQAYAPPGPEQRFKKLAGAPR